MDSNQALETSTPRAGSIGVYQRLTSGTKSGRVQVFRAIYSSTKGADGRMYGRTTNKYLVSLDSGASRPNSNEEAMLRKAGLNDDEIRTVCRRMSELAGPAQEWDYAVSLGRAKLNIDAAVDIGTSVSDAREFVLQELAHAHKALYDEATHSQSVGSANKAPACLDVAEHPQDRLLDALKSFNRACADAQSAFKQLPKGLDDADEVTLEFERAWFMYQSMVDTLKVRKDFYRPSGWTELKHQVMAESRVWRKGDPVPRATKMAK